MTHLLRRNGFVLLAIVALLGGILAVLLPAAPAGAEQKPPVFVGYCEEGEDPYDGECILDEPEGQNPDTYGPVLYDRAFDETSDTLTFTFDLPDGMTLSEAQVCLTLLDDAATDPYTPTHANTCAGTSEDRALETKDPANPLVVDVYDFFGDDEGYEPGAALWFTVHVTGNGMTLAVTGRSVPPGTPPPTRMVTVTKNVTPDTAGTFAFTLDCAETALSAANTTAEGVTFADGNAAFTLADGGSIDFTGIGDGDSCTAAETTTGWTTTVNGNAATQAVLSLDGQNATAAFVNVPLRTLTISKDVVSTAQTETFEFTVDCLPYALTAANNGASAVTYVSGVAKVTLGDNGAVEFAGIPHDTSCAVSEAVPTVAGGSWQAAVDGAAASSKRVVLDANRAVAFTNTYVAAAVQPAQQEQVAPQAQVLGVQVEKAQPLARTGASLALAAIAVSLLALGTTLVVTTRRRELS